MTKLLPPPRRQLVHSIGKRDPQEVIALARKHTKSSIQKLYDLMMNMPHAILHPRTGEVMRNPDGTPLIVQAEVPPAVQMRCAEILLERGYGKTPQAVLVGSDGSIPEGMLTIPLAQRIAAIQQKREEAMTAGVTVDLEASEQREVIELPAAEEDDPHSLI